MKNYSICIIGLLSTSLYYSQKLDSIQKVEEIVLYDNRLQIPFNKLIRNVQVLERAEINRMPIGDINEALSYIIGVDLRQRNPFGGQSDVSIDGGSFEQITILWNGVKIGDPQTGHHHLNLPIPMQAVERIEILKGPAARIYGVNSFSGAINIVTKIREDQGVLVKMEFGSAFEKKEENDGQGLYAGGQLQVSSPFSIGNTQNLIAITKQSYNGYRYNTNFDQLSVMMQGQFIKNERSKINWLAGSIKNDFGAHGYYAIPYDRESQEEVSTLVLSLGSSHQVNPKWSLSPRISFRYNEDDYRLYKNENKKGRSEHFTSVGMLELHSMYQSKYGAIGLSYESRVEQIKSSNIGDHQRFNQGFFIDYRKNIGALISLNMGMYANMNSDYGMQVFPGIDVGYQVSPLWRIAGSWGTGQRLPSFTDLYLEQLPGNVGNSELQPEASQQLELGIHYHAIGKRMYFGAYRRHSSAFIDWIKESKEMPYHPENMGGGNTLGFQFRWRQDYQLFQNHRINYQLSYQFLQSDQEKKQTNLVSKYQLEYLKHQLILGLDYQYKSFGMNVQHRYIKRLLNNAYFVADYKFKYQFSHFEIYSIMQNVYNAEYQEISAVPLPKRWISVGVDFKLQ